MKIYFFSSRNSTNVWAGYGARMWAVSASAEEGVTKGWKTKAKTVRIGQAGVIYRSTEQVFTMPFLFASAPRIDSEVTKIWPEKWAIPFSIYPLGSPHRTWPARSALKALKFFQNSPHATLNDFYTKVPQSFVPMELPESDWEIFLQQLAEPPSATSAV